MSFRSSTCPTSPLLRSYRREVFPPTMILFSQNEPLAKRTLGIDSGGLDVDRRFIHIKLLPLRASLRRNLLHASDFSADAGLGNSVLDSLGSDGAHRFQAGGTIPSAEGIMEPTCSCAHCCLFLPYPSASRRLPCCLPASLC